MEKATIPDKIELKLATLEVGQSFDKAHFIILLYKDYNFFIARSFDVHFNKAKKRFDVEKFVSKKKRILRIQ